MDPDSALTQSYTRGRGRSIVRRHPVDLALRHGAVHDLRRDVHSMTGQRQADPPPRGEPELGTFPRHSRSWRQIFSGAPDISSPYSRVGPDRGGRPWSARAAPGSHSTPKWTGLESQTCHHGAPSQAATAMAANTGQARCRPREPIAVTSAVTRSWCVLRWLPSIRDRAMGVAATPASPVQFIE